MKIERSLILVIGVFLAVGLFSGIGASATSEDIVTFVITPFNESGNRTFGGYVEDLEVEDLTEDSIEWVWENSDDDGFSYNLVFFDRLLVINGTDEFFEAEDLNDDECYEIIIISVDVYGSEGPMVSDVACTLEEEEVRKSSGKKSGVRDDDIPNFFVGESDGVGVENAVISLVSSPSSEKESFDWFVLIWMVLGFFSFVMLISIAVLLIR